MKNKLIVPIAALSFLLGTVAVGAVFAQTGEDGRPSIVENIIDRFNLNEQEVQSVVDETKDSWMAARKAQYDAWLDDEVASGNLTQEQKQLILDKQTELRQEQEQKRTELQNWAEENGVDLQYLGFGFGNKGMHHFGGGFHRMHGW